MGGWTGLADAAGDVFLEGEEGVKEESKVAGYLGGLNHTSVGKLYGCPSGLFFL